MTYNVHIPKPSSAPCAPTAMAQVDLAASLDDSEINWAVAAYRFQAARAAEEAYDKAVWMPAHRASKDGGPNIPDHVEAGMEALAAARYAVEGQWILTPAPSLHDVIAKIQYCRERWAETEWPPCWWTSIMTDLGRIAVEGSAGV